MNYFCFLTNCILYNFTKDSSIKHTDTPESIKVYVFISWEYKHISIIKQGLGFGDGIGPKVVKEVVESSRTVPTIAEQCHFSVLY